MIDNQTSAVVINFMGNTTKITTVLSSKTFHLDCDKQTILVIDIITWICGRIMLKK